MSGPQLSKFEPSRLGYVTSEEHAGKVSSTSAKAPTIDQLKVTSQTICEELP